MKQPSAVSMSGTGVSSSLLLLSIAGVSLSSVRWMSDSEDSLLSASSTTFLVKIVDLTFLRALVGLEVDLFRVGRVSGDGGTDDV